MRLRWMLCAIACALCLGVPAQALDVSALARLEDIDGLSVSPDGREIIFQRRTPDPDADRYALSWWSIAPNGDGLRRVADGGEPILLRSGARLNGLVTAPAPVWAPDCASFVLIRREEGVDRLFRVWRDGRAQLLSSAGADADVVRASLDGEEIFFAAAPAAARVAVALRREGRDGFLYDERFVPFYAPRPLLPRALATSTGAPREDVFRVTGNGPVAATAAQHARFLRPLAQPVGRTAHRRTLLQSSGRDPVATVWLEARDPVRQGGRAPLTLVAAAPPGGDPFICPDPVCVAVDFLGAWRRRNGEVVFARTQGNVDETALYAWLPGAPHARRILVTQGRLVGSRLEWSCALARDKLICFFEEARAPRRLVAVNLDSGVIETLFDPNPTIARSLSDIAIETFPVELPSGARSWAAFAGAAPHAPLVIVTYRCGGFLRGGVGDEYPVFPLIAAGYAILCVEAPSFPEEAARMDTAAYAAWLRGPGEPQKRAMQASVEAALRAVSARIDTSRVALTGLSFGAETVAYALSQRMPLAAAIASSAGIEPNAYVLYGPGQEPLFRAWELDPGRADASSRWEELSLASNAASVRTPILFNVSERELLLSLDAFSALRGAGRPAEMYVYDDAYHLKWRPAQRLAIYRRNLAWLDFWLRDEDPANAADAARWRTMRDAQSDRSAAR